MTSYKKQFTIATVVSIFFGGLWKYLSMSNDSGLILYSNIFLFLAIPVWIYACINFALDRGYHWSVGLLAGLLTFLKGIGMIILLILPDKNKNRSL